MTFSTDLIGIGLDSKSYLVWTQQIFNLPFERWSLYRNKYENFLKSADGRMNATSAQNIFSVPVEKW